MSTTADDTGSLLRRALYLAELGRLDDAESLARQALAAEPGSSPALQVLARCYASAGRYPEMLEVATEAAAITPDNANVHRSRAWALIGLGRGREARAAAERARALDPADHRGELVLARALLAVGGTAVVLAAADAVARARRLAPEAAEVYVTGGHVHRRMAEFGPARAAYAHALRVEPENSAALHGLATLDTARGRMFRASSTLSDSLAMEPDDPRALGVARRAARGAWWLLTDAGCLVLLVFLLASTVPRALSPGSAGRVGAVLVVLAGAALAAGLLGWRFTRLPVATRALIRDNRWRFTFVVARLRMDLLAVAALILAGSDGTPTSSPGPARILAYLVLGVAVLLLALRVRNWLIRAAALLVRRLWFRSAAGLAARARPRVHGADGRH